MTSRLIFSIAIFALGLTGGTLSASPAAAREPVDVYLIGGQSNATGQGYMKNLPAGFQPDPRVRLFHSGTPHLNSGDRPYVWIALRQASESPDRFGPELGFGNRLQELRPGRTNALIKHAHSGTDLAKQWAPGADDADRADWGPQFAIFVETVEAGLQGLRDQGCEPTIRGMIWQQGENDAARDDANATGYGRNLAHFINRVREHFRAPEMVFVYGYVLPPLNDQPGRAGVRQGQRDVDQNSGSPLAVPGAFVVATDDLTHRSDDPNTPYPNDHLHFSTAGTLELGRRMAETMQSHLPAKP